VTLENVFLEWMERLRRCIDTDGEDVDETTGGALSPFACRVRHKILPHLNPNCTDGVYWVCGLDGWGVRTKQTLGRQISETEQSDMCHNVRKCRWSSGP
jgi:hypothetical protein